MSHRRRTPSTPYRSSGRRPALWFPILLALATALLALPAARIALAQTTVTIANGATDTAEGVTITNNSGQSCQFTVHQSSEAPGGDPADWGEMSLQWDITSDCPTVLVDLVFQYSDGDVWYGVNESELSVFWYDSGSGWVDQCAASCVNEGANTGSVTGVTVLGDWTIAEASEAYPGPTAVTTRGPARGASFDESALVLGLSVLTGIGLILGWRLRKPAV